MDLAPRDHAEALLIKVGRSYGVHVGRDEVRRALADVERGPAFAEWANMHLGSDHLLTADELALYTALDRSGQVDKLADMHDLGEVQAVNEDEIRTAIEELNRSTASISKQTETLRQQQDALSRLLKKSGEAEAQRRDLESTRQRKSDTERKRLASEVEELSQSLDFRVSDLEQQAKDLKANLTQTIDGVFHSDDKLLSSLQKLGWELDQDDPEEEQTVEKLREICMRQVSPFILVVSPANPSRLIKNTVETLRTRLDRVYLEAILAAERSGESSKPANEGDVKALEEELESLYSEILPVAQMSAEQEHLEPALKSTNSQSGQSLNRSAAAVSYVSQCLDYLLDRIDCLSKRVETLKSHQTATSTLISTAKTEISVPISPVTKPTQPALPASPVRNPSPIRMRSNTGQSRSYKRRSSGFQDEPAIEALLRNLTLSLPFTEENTSEEQVASLAHVLAERSNKVHDVSRNAQETFESSTVSKLEDARLAIQLLRDSVLAESPFAEVKLVDPEIEGSIHVLGQEVQKVKERLDAVDAKKGSGKSEKKDELLRRWGS
ncbi:Fc.00g107340.m01.CDS01 [Cosmosporella sp. VM-42]